MDKNQEIQQLRIAEHHFRTGNIDIAEKLAKLILKSNPRCSKANELLAYMAGNRGDVNSAYGLLLRAASEKDCSAEAHYYLGSIHLRRKEFLDAVPPLRNSLKIAGDFFAGLHDLGAALAGSGQYQEALSTFERAKPLKQDSPELFYNLACTLDALDRHDEALTCYDMAIRLKPDYAEAWSNYGAALNDLYRYDEALACCEKAVRLRPDLAGAHNNMGAALKNIGRLDEAVASCRRALEIEPKSAEIYSNLASVLCDLGKLDEAAASSRHAIQIKPDYAKAHYNLGNALRDSGQFEDAEASYRRALEIKPDFADALSNLLFVLNHTTHHTPLYRLEQARQYGRIVAAKAVARFSAWTSDVRRERLKVGLVSGDLRNHPVGHFLEGLLTHIDPARIELIAYPTQHKEDELTARIRPYFAAWKPLTGKIDEVAARLIHADGVHVLLDLSGHTAHNRLPVFAWKPAPVQASWLGYFATTGVAEMDYLLVDEVGVPEAQQQQFTESVWYLPDTRLCFTAPRVDLPVAPLPALHNGYVTFGCFQTLAKVGDEVLAAWGQILTALPNAKLRVQCKQLGDAGVAAQFLASLQRQGIDPARVSLHGAVSREAYLAAHAEVDMILDTFPYPGGTTTCEALWMGVPTLTLAGDSLLARQGASLLSAAGLEDWVATSKEKYVAKAIALASDLPRLAALRAGLRQQVLACPLFDAPRFARHLEDALWGMWQRYQAQQ